VTNAAVEAAGPQVEKFATPAGRILGYVVVGAAVVLSLLAVNSQGTGALGLIGFCVAFSALAWVMLIRPRVTAHRNGLVLRNMLRDTFVPWATIKSCRVAQTLQIGTRDKVYHGLGVTKSARQVTREQRKRGSRKTVFGPNLGFSSLASAPTISADPDEGMTVDKAKEEHIGGSYFTHTEQRIETLALQGASKTAGEQPKVVWDPVAIGGVVLAALAVVFGLVT
jgi:Bacterial PH domain